MDINQHELDLTSADNQLPKSRGSAAVPRFEQFLYSSSASEHTSAIDTTSHAHTTVDSKRDDEDTHDKSGSLYSYNSTRDITDFVREMYGRIFNNLNDVYALPTDALEWGRLDKQGSAFLICFGGLYPRPDVVDAVLTASGTEAKRILDVGCGTGAWAIQMAIRFPHCIVKGIDVAPTPTDSGTLPPNVSFEIDDINHGLVHFYDQYDLIHMRCVKSGITDMEVTLYELERCLKPGGILIIIDADLDHDDENHNRIKMKKIDGDEDVSGVSEDGSWYQRLFWECVEASTIAGSDCTDATRLFDLGFWEHPLCDPETAGTGSIYMPIGPWAHSSDTAGDQELKYVGTLMRQGCLNLHRAFHAILRKHGIPQETLNSWSRHIDKELNDLKKRMWIRFHFAWTRRRAGEGVPAPPLALLSERHTRLLASSYPALEACHSQDEAIAAWEKREKTVGVRPRSLVKRVFQST